MWPFTRLNRKSTVTTHRLDEIARFFGYELGGSSMSEKQALQVSAVMCAVRVISEGVAQMPVRIRRRRQIGDHLGSEPARSHFAWSLFNVRPNDFQTPFQFIEHAMTMAALTGDFVALKVRDGAGRTRELLPLVPGVVNIRRDQTWRITYEIRYEDRVSGVFEADDVFHLRGPSWNTYQGYQPVQLAAETLGLTRNLERMQAKSARAGGRPSGIVSFESALSPERIEQVKRQWQEQFSVSGEGGVALLDGQTKFTPISMSAVDGQHIETRKFQIEEVARTFRVFPQMLMHSDKTATFASASEFFRAHVTHTLGPWVARFEQAINLQIIGAAHPGIFADFDERALLRGSFEEQATYVTQLLGAGGHPPVMTQNEARQFLGMDPLEDEAADRLPPMMGQEPVVEGE